MLTILGILFGGVVAGIVAALANHYLRQRRDIRAEVVSIYCDNLLEPIADAGSNIFHEVRDDSQTRLDLESYVRESFDEKMRKVRRRELLRDLPEGFHKLPSIYRDCLREYANNILYIHSYRRQRDVAGAQLRAEEIGDLIEKMGIKVGEATKRIRNIGAWNNKKMMEKIRMDEELLSLAAEIENIEEDLEQYRCEEDGNHPGDED